MVVEEKYSNLIFPFISSSIKCYLIFGNYAAYKEALWGKGKKSHPVCCNLEITQLWRVK